MSTLEILRLVAEIILAVVAAGGFKNWTDTKKYRQEVEKLRAEVESAKTNTRSNELENVKKAMAILMEEVVEPLKKEINAIRKEMARLRRAVEKVSVCPHSADCPVRRELQSSEERDRLLLPKPIEIPKLIPVQIPPDSAWLRAYLACDSNNQVIMQAFEEQKGKGIGSSLKLNNGILDFHVLFLHDTLYIPGKDSLIYVPVEIPGPETNVLSWWQQLWIKLGKALSSGIALYLFVRLLIKRFK